MQDKLTKLFIVIEHLRLSGLPPSNGWGSSVHGMMESIFDRSSLRQWERTAPNGSWRSVPYFGLSKLLRSPR